MMEPIRQRFSVTFSYEVLFTRSLFDADNSVLKTSILQNVSRRPVRLLFVIDQGVIDHHPLLEEHIQSYISAHKDVLVSVADPIIVPGGEQVKNDPVYVHRVQEAVSQGAICRHSFVIAIGGGAVLDMVGYAAATSHRGVRHIRIPTTVLSQNDSGVGVKNGINAFDSKNFLGTFAPPVAVINDFDFLHTLDDRDWRSGISEAIKVALIKDEAFFTDIEGWAKELSPSIRGEKAMQHVIHRCAAMHVEHIGQYGDPFESGSSRPLDFGHWAAHKLEALTGYELRHGEAVAIGIALDCMYAHVIGRLGKEPLERILSVMERLGFELFSEEMMQHLDNPSHPRSVFRGLDEFREHLGGELTIMLLNDIGEAVEVHDVDYEAYKQAVLRLKERAYQRSLKSNGVLGMSV